jgi:transposase
VGRPRHDHRTVLGGILWVLRTDSPWREMPARFGQWDTADARYRLWRKQGLWQQIINTLGPASSHPISEPEAALGQVSL